MQPHPFYQPIPTVMPPYPFDLTQSLAPAQNDDAVLDTTVGGLLREVAAAHGDRMAMTEITMEGDRGRRWTYAQLLADSERLALALSSRYAPGERVCVWAPNIPEWLLMEYGCALAGLTLVTANPSYQASEVRYVLEQSGSVGLFIIQSYRGNPMAEIAAEACRGLDAVREIVDMDDHEALFRHGERTPFLPEVKPDDPAQIQYTSGTTGFPKGALLPHRGLTNNGRLIFKRGLCHPGTVWANYMPMFHTSGCAIAALGCLQTPCHLLMVKFFDPDLVLRVIEREKVTAAVGVPTMLIAMLEAMENKDYDVSSVEMSISGGSMVAPELVRRVKKAFGCDFEIVYGQTETSPVITQSRHDDSIEDLCNTVGQPLPCTDVAILDPQTNEIMPVGEIGEICCRGYLNMIGYNNNPDATAATIDAEKWLHTGDLGFMDARGYVTITGRVKEMIIRGGENLFPAEIENVLLEHPDVAEVAVVGLPDDKWGEIVACFARMERGAETTGDDLHAYCRQHLSPQKTPAVWIRVDDYPLTGSGKIQKFAVRDLYEEGAYDGREF